MIARRTPNDDRWARHGHVGPWLNGCFTLAGRFNRPVRFAARYRFVRSCVSSLAATVNGFEMVVRRYVATDGRAVFARHVQRSATDTIHPVNVNGYTVAIIAGCALSAGVNVWVVASTPTNGDGRYDVVHVAIVPWLDEPTDDDTWIASLHVLDGGGPGDDPLPGVDAATLGSDVRSPVAIAAAVRAALLAYPVRPTVRRVRGGAR